MTTKEIADVVEIKAEIVAYMGNVIDEAQQIALAVKDDASAEQATSLGVAIKSKIAWLKAKREEVYVPLMKATERVRNEYDEPLKLGAKLEATLSAAIIKYRLDKKREEERLRLAAEAEARKVREEAARKEREAEAERQRVLREQEERERQRRAEADAEERRKLAEKKAAEDAERARMQKEQEERARLIREEEDARLSKAQEAHDVGLPERVETIMETPTAIAPVAKPLPTSEAVAAEAERKRKEDEEAAEAERKRKAAWEEEQKKREEEAAHVRQLQEDAARTKADAEMAEASAGAIASVSQVDDRMRTNVSAKYQVVDVPSFRKLALAVAEGRAPVEFLGYDPEAPEKFRAAAVGKHATKIKNLPDFSTKQAELLAIGITCWLEEGGGFKAEKEAA